MGGGNGGRGVEGGKKVVARSVEHWCGCEWVQKIKSRFSWGTHWFTVSDMFGVQLTISDNNYCRSCYHFSWFKFRNGGYSLSCGLRKRDL